jgi:hypothetical protein
MPRKPIPTAPPGPPRQCCFPSCEEEAIFRLWPEDTKNWMDEYVEVCPEHLSEMPDDEE